HMYGSGMFIINPPWQLDEMMNETLDFLTPVFSAL
ncbi:MAG: 23S rRNA (adenine(2030)-N(6))-methyltransferase RlmJ, partial [Treponema sp.]|nr:23S rRNA (adenine(2030)-N(6))-methyltransferase RlmJ [Treponema sp.]